VKIVICKLKRVAIPVVLLLMTVIGTCWSHYQIEITKKDNKLILYEDGKKKATYSVATGRTPDLTPEGTFTLGVKIKQPGWKHISGGDPKNPLGPMWLGFSTNNDLDRARMFGIHGTNSPKSIGQYASGGCIRMYNKRVLQLSEILPEGTPIWIHSESSTGEWKGDTSHGLSPLEKSGYIQSDHVDILSGCSKGAFKLKSLAKETPIEVTGMVNDWYQVNHGETTGFIHKSHIQLTNTPTTNNSTTNPTTTTNTTTQPNTNPTNIRKHNKPQFKQSTNLPDQPLETTPMKVKTKSANIRKKPSVRSAILHKVSQGHRVTVLSEQKNWFYVRLSDATTGYIHKSVVTVSPS
jgi:SH3-like domain-containing protein